jgi:hypothetical protein
MALPFVAASDHIVMAAGTAIVAAHKKECHLRVAPVGGWNTSAREPTLLTEGRVRGGLGNRLCGVA